MRGQGTDVMIFIKQYLNNRYIDNNSYKNDINYIYDFHFKKYFRHNIDYFGKKIVCSESCRKTKIR
jgi:hypothetical protein